MYILLMQSLSLFPYRLPSKLLYRTAVVRLITKYPHLKDDIEDQSGMVIRCLSLSFSVILSAVAFIMHVM